MRLDIALKDSARASIALGAFGSSLLGFEGETDTPGGVISPGSLGDTRIDVTDGGVASPSSFEAARVHGVAGSDSSPEVREGPRLTEATPLFCVAFTSIPAPRVPPYSSFCRVKPFPPTASVFCPSSCN